MLQFGQMVYLLQSPIAGKGQVYQCICGEQSTSQVDIWRCIPSSLLYSVWCWWKQEGGICQSCSCLTAVISGEDLTVENFWFDFYICLLRLYFYAITYDIINTHKFPRDLCIRTWSPLLSTWSSKRSNISVVAFQFECVRNEAPDNSMFCSHPHLLKQRPSQVRAINITMGNHL